MDNYKVCPSEFCPINNRCHSFTYGVVSEGLKKCLKEETLSINNPNRPLWKLFAVCLITCTTLIILGLFTYLKIG